MEKLAKNQRQREQIIELFSRLKCPVHNQTPQYNFFISAYHNVGVDVNLTCGCKEEYMRVVKSEIKNIIPDDVE